MCCEMITSYLYDMKTAAHTDVAAIGLVSFLLLLEICSRQSPSVTVNLHPQPHHSWSTKRCARPRGPTTAVGGDGRTTAGCLTRQEKVFLTQFGQHAWSCWDIIEAITVTPPPPPPAKVVWLVKAAVCLLRLRNLLSNSGFCSDPPRGEMNRTEFHYTLWITWIIACWVVKVGHRGRKRFPFYRRWISILQKRVCWMQVLYSICCISSCWRGIIISSQWFFCTALIDRWIFHSPFGGERLLFLPHKHSVCSQNIVSSLVFV